MGIWVADAPSVQEQQPRQARRGSHCQAIVEDRQAEVAQSFQEQVCARLQAIESKLDKLVYKLPSATKLQPPRRGSFSSRSSSWESCHEPFVGALPGVLATERKQTLQLPMSPPPPEPLPSRQPRQPVAVDAWRERGSDSPRIRMWTPPAFTPFKQVRGRFDDNILSLRQVSVAQYSQTKLWRLVHSAPFRTVFSVAIVVNAFFIGLAVDAELSALIQKQKPDKEWVLGDVFFCVLFFVELLVRAVAERGHFFFGEWWMWNWFDSVLIVHSILDTVMTSLGTMEMANIDTVRFIRFVRFIRLMRLGRTVHAIQQLRLFILSILAAGVSLLWCALMVTLILYVFAICFLNGVTEYFRGGDRNVDEEATIADMYPNVWSAMVTLFMSISGGIDWHEAMEPLAAIHWAYGIAFVYFIFFMFFGVFNIVVGAFVTACTETSKRDRKLLVKSKLESLDAYTAKIKGFFAEADKDASGTLSWEEFQGHLRNPEVMAYFASLDLDVSNAHRLFRLLDTNNNDEVGVREFLDGCMRLKGEAKSIDVNMLVYEIRQMSRTLSHFIEASESRFSVSNHSGDIAEA